MNKEHEYAIVDENEDPRLSVIEKSNLTATFTIEDMEGEQRLLEKHLKEFHAQRLISDAKVQNIENYHPFVKDLTEEQCFTVHLYQESKAMVHVLDKKIPEFEEQLRLSQEEMALVKEKLGLKTDEEIVDEAVAKIVDNG